MKRSKNKGAKARKSPAARPIVDAPNPACDDSPAWMPLYYATAILLLGLSLWLRVDALDHLPGVNADETYVSVLVRDFLRGDSTMSPFVTPSRRYSPIYTLPVLLIEWLGVTPSIWALRLPAVLFGLVTVVATWAAARLIFKRQSVVVGATLLTACLPAHIVYSRIGWDAAHNSLATILLVFGVLRGRWWIVGAGAVLGLIVHPLTAFLLPTAAAFLVFETVPQSRLSKQHKGGLILLAAAALLVLAGLLFARFLGNADMLTQLLHRAMTPSAWWQHARDIAEVFSGTSTLNSSAGTPQGLMATALDLMGLALGMAFMAACFSLYRNHALPMRERWYGLSLLAGLAIFHVMRNTHEVGTERYLLVFTVPCILACALALDRSRVSHAFIRAGTMALCTLMLSVFFYGHIQALQRPDASRSSVIATGPVEPKKAAFDWIMADRDSRFPSAKGPTVIVTDRWWTYWPMRFFGHKDQPVRVLTVPAGDSAMPREDMLMDVASLEEKLLGPAYVVGFSNGHFNRINGMLQRAHVCQQVDFAGFEDKPIISVWRYCANQADGTLN